MYPDDEITTFKKLAEVLEARDPEKVKEKYHELKDGIKGFGVEFPLNFLIDENLKKFKTFEFGLHLVPSNIFT